MQRLCTLHSLNYQVVNAVCGHDLSDKYIDQVTSKHETINHHGRELTKGEIGCALSHLSIYKHMIVNEIQSAIIFEDDIYLDDDFQIVMNSIDKSPKNFDIILLGYHSDIDVNTEKKTRSSYWHQTKITPKYKCVRLVQLAYGTYGYLISLRGAKKLATQLKTITEPIDHYTGVDTHINLYALDPRVIHQNPRYKNSSNIQTEREEMDEQYNIHYTKNTSPLKKILQHFGLYYAVKELLFFYDRIKILRKHKP